VLPERLLVGVKDAKYDDVIVGDGKMDGEEEGIDKFNAHVIVADGGGGREMSDIFKIAVESISKLGSPGRQRCRYNTRRRDRYQP